MKTATIDLTGESKQYVGTLYIGGTHPAANGGAWMSAVLGLCGIRYAVIQSPSTRTCPPTGKKSFSRSVCGKKVKITLTHDKITVRSVNLIETPLSVSVGESVYPLHPTGEIHIPAV